VYPADDQATFALRLERFFSVFSREYARRNPTRSLRGICLQVGRLRWADNAVDAVHTVGRYDVDSARFDHTWRVER
jgi:hypothetical protein